MLNLVPLRHYLKDGALVEAVQYRGNLTEAEAAAIHRWIEVGGGTVEPTADDWVIRDNTGEFVICKPDMFEQEYEPVA
ncbi:hypothetical protein [Nocardia wallacei]|uniref:hypothetical protein n=1 Tax=Nocardia wallacei TaxID=480035 RepID=UPI0024545923|nr:hypothetical protein [Nocardia wallacei]